MAIPNPEPTPPPATVWPPAPLHTAVPPPLFVSAEGIEVTESGGRLVFVNKFTRRFLIFETCLMLSSSSSPWITFWTSRFHPYVLSGLLPYVLMSYRTGFPIYLIMLFFLAGVWCVGYFMLSSSGIVFNSLNKTIKANGKIKSLSKIEAVRIMQGQSDIIRRRFMLALVWEPRNRVPWWQRSLNTSLANTTFLGQFKQEANAEKIAAAIAEFANVPVQHRTR